MAPFCAASSAMRRASVMPMRPGLTLSAVAPRSRNWAASLSEAQRGIDQHRDRAQRQQLDKLRVGMQLAGVLGDLRAFAGDGAHVLGGLGARIGAVGVDIEIDAAADRGADLAQRREIGVDALAALDLQRAKAMALDDLGRLARHRLRRLPRHAPAHLDAVLALQQAPQRLVAGRRPQRPAGVVDQHLRQKVLGKARERLADRRRHRRHRYPAPPAAAGPPAPRRSTWAKRQTRSA